MQPQQLQTQSPNHITYEHGMVRITVLGGIRLEGLDRMRATLKIEVEHLTMRHNLDLYNDTQVEKLIRRVAEKLEVGTSLIAAALQELTNQLEEYRLQEIEKQQADQITTYQLTEQERKAAELYLSSPNLIERTREDIGRSGVVGEETNRLLMYLIFTSRKREQPLHVVSLGSSGSGKTHLQESVGRLIPAEDKLEITTLSENAFYYFGQRQLQNKLILIEDLDGAESVLYPLRELQSKKKISKTVVHKNTKGETRSINLTVEGPVSVAGCTTREKIYEDNANRSFLLYLDEGAEQDQRIMEYQKKRSAGKINTTEQETVAALLQNTQRVLKPIKVINPYAQQLELPREVFKPRRTNNHYLQFIEAVTFYHQYQREEQADPESGEVYIQTTIEDIQIANQLLKEVLLRKSDELSGACRNYFETLKAHLSRQEDQVFTNSQISQQLRIPNTTIKRHHLDLLNSNRIKLIEAKKSKGYRYQIINDQEYKELQTKISTVLDQVLSKLKPNSPNAAQSKSGLPKRKKTKSLTK